MSKILILDMYSSKNIFKKDKKRFKKCFSNKTKLYFKRWDDYNGIKLILKNKINGIIISGSDYFVGDKLRAIIQPLILNSGIPLLSICYGFQYIIGKNNIRSFDSYKRYKKSFIIRKPFYVPKTQYYFYHRDYVVKKQNIYKVSVKRNGIIYMIYDIKNKNVGVQFHPERYIKTGKIFFKNWLKYINN